MSATGINKMTSADASNAYAHSFGFMRDQSVYYKPSAFEDKYDVNLIPELKALMDKGIVQMKAQTYTGMGAGTAGMDLIPVYVDPRIVDASRKFTPWSAIIQRVTNMGLTADYNSLTAKGGAYTGAEDCPLPEKNDTESRSSTAIKYLYSVGRVTGQVNATMPSYMVQGMQVTGDGASQATFSSPSSGNAMQYEVLKKTQSMKELEENLFWNGNATTSGITGNPNGTEYNGMVALQSTTNQNDLSATALDWEDIDTTVEYAFVDSGRPVIMGCDSSSLKDMRKIMIDTFNYRPSDLGGGLSFGVPARLRVETMLGTLPVVPSQYLSTTTGAKQIWFMDLDYIEHRVVQDMTYEKLAKVNDSQKFMLKQYQSLIDKNTGFNSFIDNIA